MNMHDSVTFAGVAVGGIGAVMTLVTLAEMAFDAVKRRGRDWRETASNFMVGIPNQALTLTVVGAAVAAGLHAVARLAPTQLGYGPVTWIVAAVAVDFLYYWSHRLEHRVSVLWGHHSVHHSSTSFDLSTSLRIAWHDGIFATVYLAPLAVLGFPPLMVLVLFEGVLIYQTWVHTQRIGRVPLIEGILNTPAAHRVHHATNAPCIDKNHGGVLMIWDRLFGTWLDERDLGDAPLCYGLTVPPPGINPLRVNFRHYLDIWALARRARSFQHVVLAVFGPPEWTPEGGFAATSPTSWWRRLWGMS
jgi:sterol desaturase/sphingolipid hydroxylase (fatty acid hydroxylase superfamily)